jgi:hypothetical protein
VAAKLRVVGSDTVANLEALDVVGHGWATLLVLWSGHGDPLYPLTNNDTNCLVSRDQRELGDELALVDVEVSAADAAGL